MMIPQIKNTLIAIVIILVGVPLLTAYALWQAGELRDFAHLWPVIDHSIFGAFMLSIGWIFFKSPFAGKITEILQTAKSPSGVQTETSIKITEPAPTEPKKE